MSYEYAICKRCSHIDRNHLLYQRDNECIKYDCQQFIESIIYQPNFTVIDSRDINRIVYKRL